MHLKNPITGQALPDLPWMDEGAVYACLKKSREAYQAWRQTSLEERCQALLALADQLEAHAEEGAFCITQAMGKPLALSRAEIDKSIQSCRHYASQAATYLAPQTMATEWSKSEVHTCPLGPILAIMPWNYPIWQVMRCLVPNVLLGNTVLLSHAPIAQPCAFWLAGVIEKAAWPAHLFTPLVMEHALCAKAIAHPLIAGVTLTGSTRAGRQVAALAGEHLKPCVLELGGNDPYIVLADADVEMAAQTCVAMRLANSGQVCISAKRIIVEKSVFKSFLSLVKQYIQSYKVGDPTDPTTDLGPLARGDLRDLVHQQVSQSVAIGATLHLGGQVPDGPGFYYPITLLTDVTPGMPAFDEEVFGPVIALIEAEDEAHAIALANQSDYGLGGCVFSKDIARAKAIVRDQLEVGFATVNAPVSSHLSLPFGGIKQSGFGRELGVEGIRSFANIKAVCIKD